MVLVITDFILSSQKVIRAMNLDQIVIITGNLISIVIQFFVFASSHIVTLANVRKSAKT